MDFVRRDRPPDGGSQGLASAQVAFRADQLMASPALAAGYEAQAAALSPQLQRKPSAPPSPGNYADDVAGKGRPVEKGTNDDGTPTLGRQRSRECRTDKLANLPQSIMGAHQKARIDTMLGALTPADYVTFRGLLGAAGSDYEAGFIFKALAAANTMDRIVWFAGEIAGMSLEELLAKCTLGERRKGKDSVTEQDSWMGCGANVTIVVRGNYDPVYALQIRLANKDDLSDYNRREHAMLEDYGDDIGDGTKAMRAGDALNRQTSATGMTFSTLVRPDPEEAIAILDSKVGAGMQTPVMMKLTDKVLHYLLCIHVSTDEQGQRVFTFHDSRMHGDIRKYTEDEIRNPAKYTLGLEIEGIEVPTAL